MSLRKHLILKYFLWFALGVLLLCGGVSAWFFCCFSGQILGEPLSDYACEVEFDDYSWWAVRKSCDIVCMPEGGRCLGITKDGYAAHNLDWLLADEVECLIHVKGNESRFASIGLSSCNPFLKRSDIENPCFKFTNYLIPAMTVDGINEKGVFICVNVAPKGEGHADISQWNYGKLTTLNTNPEADETVCTILLVRYVLDHATSACCAGDPTSAWNLVNQVNWYSADSEFMDQEFHWLIADKDSSFVLEIIDNKLVMLPNETAMSNFYLGVNGGYQPHGEGYERYGIVKDSYDSIAGSDDMMDVLEKCWFSRLYDFSPSDTLHFRYSDLRVDRPVGEPDEAFLAHCDSMISYDLSVPARDPECQRWATRHSAVYDLQNLSLKVCFDEKYEMIERSLRTSK